MTGQNNNGQNGNGSLPESRVESREERRARLREIAKRVAGMTDEQRAELASRVPAIFNAETGKPLSTHNTCLLIHQIENPTLVAGIRQWNRQGRRVQKGQHQLVIWCPVGRKDKDTGEIQERTGFVLGGVFDVSQTIESNGNGGKP